MKEQRKGNQTGFTLIELLVAIALIALIAIPVSSAFMTSMETDVKAKMKLRATTVATNVMENLKTQSIDKLLQEVDDDAAKGTMTSRYRLLSKEDDSGVYVLAPRNAEEMDGKKFDVEIRLDPSTASVTPLNEKELAQLYSMQGKNDGAYLQNSDENEKYAAMLKEGTSYTQQTLYTGVRRFLDVTIDRAENDATGKEETKVVVSNRYTFAGAESKSTGEEEIFSSEEEDALQRIYLCYNPMYRGQDVITVFNPKGIPVVIYLVCQNYNAYEAGTYTPQFRCLDQTENGTKLCSNLSLTNKGKGLQLSFLPVDSSKPNQKPEITDQEWSNAMKKYNAKNLLDFRDLANAKQEQWVYEVTVTVREEKHEKILATFTSTMEKK